jgi:hypothetical protein
VRLLSSTTHGRYVTRLVAVGLLCQQEATVGWSCPRRTYVDGCLSEGTLSPGFKGSFLGVHTTLGVVHSTPDKPTLKVFGDPEALYRTILGKDVLKGGGSKPFYSVKEHHVLKTGLL